jgi:hypothetical protein
METRRARSPHWRSPTWRPACRQDDGSKAHPDSRCRWPANDRATLPKGPWETARGQASIAGFYFGLRRPAPSLSVCRRIRSSPSNSPGSPR